MTYDEIIHHIMPLVKDNSSLPFIINRNGSGWEINYLNLTPDDAAKYLETVRESDPFAVKFTGADFDGGSYPFIYDKVLAARLYAEYNANKFDFGNIGEYSALVNLLDDHLGELSSSVAEFIAAREKPLVAIFDMLPISLKAEGKPYDADKVDEVINLIESQAARLNKISEHQKTDDVIVENGVQSGKHNIEGYEERASMQLAGRIVILAEKPGADDPYMVVNCKWDNPLGVDEYYDAVVTPDYLEAVREYVRREAVLLDFLEAARSLSGLPCHTLTAADCIPKSMDESLIGKVVVVRPDALAHEYRSAEYQITRVDSGNGANPEARGRAVFCTNLYDGKQVRHERHQIAGVIDPAKMPEWAKVKLAELQAGIKTPPAALDDIMPQKAKTAGKKPTLQDRLDAAKETVREATAHKDDRGGKLVDGLRPKKRGDMEV